MDCDATFGNRLLQESLDSLTEKHLSGWRAFVCVSGFSRYLLCIKFALIIYETCERLELSDCWLFFQICVCDVFTGMPAIREDLRGGRQQLRRQRGFRGTAERTGCTITLLLYSLPPNYCSRRCTFAG